MAGVLPGGAPLSVTLIPAAEVMGGGGGGSKVAYVNTQAILKATPGYASAESAFTREVETYRAEVQKLQASLDSAASDFETEWKRPSEPCTPRSNNVS